MAWTPLFASESLPEGGMKLYPHGKREIGVFRRDGELYAVLNFCPHAGAAICHGEVDYPVHTDTPGGASVRNHNQPTIRCPWHHWEFDLRTGNAICPISPRLKVYPVRETDGQVWADL